MSFFSWVISAEKEDKNVHDEMGNTKLNLHTWAEIGVSLTEADSAEVVGISFKPNTTEDFRFLNFRIGVACIGSGSGVKSMMVNVTPESHM